MDSDWAPVVAAVAVTIVLGVADAVEASLGLDEWGSGEAIALAAVYADHLATLEGARA